MVLNRRTACRICGSKQPSPPRCSSSGTTLLALYASSRPSFQLNWRPGLKNNSLRRQYRH
ncbi:hypothetical protein NFI96_010707 [Prochilodus magdalenae]|nr:hypothetical protein NFI96_010707 [Prochilodus magdalenae]